MNFLSRRRSVALSALLSLALTFPALAQLTADNLVVTPGNERVTFAIAVPAFEASGEALPGINVAEIVQNDLKLSGFFRPPDNAEFARETDLLDRQSGTIHYADWNRIKVSFLVRGNYTISGGELTAEVRTYDTVSQIEIFGKRYTGFRPSNARELAHRISDDIIKRVLDEDGNSRTRIVFIRQLDPYGKTKQVCVMDSDGANIEALTGVGELAATPTWGARGTEIYYTTYKDFNPDLAGLILSNKRTWWISRQTGFNLSPCWSEAKQSIALVLTKDGNSEIYTLRRDGQDLKRVTTNRAIDSSPVWSRDGNMLAFQSDRTGSPQIFVKDLRSGDERRITHHSSYNDAPSWTQAGQDRIAFCSRIDGRFQIFTCKPDGSDLLRLTTGSNNEDPTWAPNGLEIVFTSDRTGRKQLYRMFADGSNVNQLTHDAASQSAAWSPQMP